MTALAAKLQSNTRKSAGSVLKIAIFLGILGVTLPFWLPESLGGDIALQFVLTGSMKGELDPGSFVLVRRSNDYQAGDIAVYKLTQSNGKSISIVHRIVGRLPDGRYIFKGDANRSSETVDPQQIIGKLVVGIPGLGFLPGAIKAAPVIVGLLLIAPFMLGRNKNKSVQRKSLYLPTLAVVGISLPFFSSGLAETLGVMQASLLILGFLGAARLVDKTDPWPEFKAISDIAYMLIIAMAVLMVPFPELKDSFDLLRTEFIGGTA